MRVAEVVLFHHVCGLTSGLASLADELRELGHQVHTPDLYDGQTRTSIEDGVELSDQIGFGALLERASDAVRPLATDVVYMGISMGAMHAQAMTLSRPGARGAVLLEGCVAVPDLGAALQIPSPAWPQRVPVQIHGMQDDPFFAGEGDIENARAIVADVDGSELITYQGGAHLFCDRSLASFDPAAFSLMLERLAPFLASLDRTG